MPMATGFEAGALLHRNPANMKLARRQYKNTKHARPTPGHKPERLWRGSFSFAWGCRLARAAPGGCHPCTAALHQTRKPH